MKPRLRELPRRGDYSKYELRLNERVVKFQIKEDVPINLDYYLLMALMSEGVKGI